MRSSFTKISFLCFFLIFWISICPEQKMLLSSNINYQKFQFEKNNFFCRGLGAIKTRDKGYLIAGVETYSFKSIKGNISLSKYDPNSNLQYKIQPFPSFEEMIFYRLQETNSYYYFIIALKLTTSSPSSIQIYRIDKNGTIIKNFPLNVVSVQECGLLILIMKNDQILISACNYFVTDNEYISYIVYHLDSAQILDNIKLGGPSCEQSCNTFILRSVAINPIDEVILFEGNINSDRHCPSCKPCCSPCPIHFHCSSGYGFLEFLYYQVFNSKFFEQGNIVKHSLFNDPKGLVPSCNDFKSGKVTGTGRDEIYHFMSVYQSSESNFIAMKMTGFDIPYVIIDDLQNIGPRQTFIRPVLININSLSSFQVSQLIFDDPYFIFAGIGQAYSTNAIIVGAYHKISNSGFINYFPESLPGVCTGINCNFGVAYVSRILSNNFIVSGWGRFPKSLNDEWIKLIYDLTSGNLVNSQRIVNNLNFEAIGIINLSDSFLLQYGNDIYALALVKYKSNFEIFREARIDSQYSLKIFSIASSASSCFFAGGSIEKYDNSGQYGIIISIDNLNFEKITEFIFARYSELSKIILSTNDSIYGLANYINRQDSFLFKIETSLKPNSFEKVEFVYRFLSDLKETGANKLVIVGQNLQTNIMFIVLYNLRLQVEIPSPNFKQFLHFKTKVVFLKSVSIINENKIMAVGSVTDNSQDCISILLSNKLEIMSYKYFGSNGIDDSFHILSMDDGHAFITGTQSTVSFVSLFTSTNKMIKEFIFPFEQLKLLSSMENFYRHEISVGYQKNGLFNEMRLFYITIDISCPRGYMEDLDTAMCSEICGDNINYGNFECDNYDRECCTDNCTLTPYHSTIIDPISKHEICKREYLVYANYSMSNNKIIVTFSNKMSFCDKILSKNLTLDDVMKSGQIFIRNNSMQKEKIQITGININLETCDNLTISVFNKNSILQYSKFLHIDLKGEFFTDINDVLLSNHFANLNINYTLNSQDDDDFNYEYWQRIFLIIGLTTSMLSAFLGRGIEELLAFIGPLQIIILFSLINIQHFPTKALRVINANSILSLNFDAINKNLFLLIENETGVQISSSIYVDDNSKNHPSLNLINIFFNLGSKIFIIIIYPSYFLVLYFLSKKIRAFDKYLNSFTWNGFIKLFHGLYFEFFICSLMQFFHQNYLYFWFNNLENVLASVSVLAILLYCLKIFGILSHLTPTECFRKNAKKSVGALYSHTRFHLLFAKYQILVFYFRRFLSIILLFAFMDFPKVQAILFGLVSFLNILYLVLVKHEEDRIKELSNMFIEILIMTLHIDFIILVYIHNTNNYYYNSLVDYFVYGAEISTLVKSGFSLVNSIHSLLQFIKKVSTKLSPQNTNNLKIKDISKEMSDHTSNVLGVKDNLSFQNKGDPSSNPNLFVGPQTKVI